MVTGPVRPGHLQPGPPGTGAGQRNPKPDARPQPGARPAGARAGSAPLRLTRRGRIVVTVVAILLATVVVTVIGMAAPGGAQAANHGRVGAGYAGMHQIVVRLGQTLWSVAVQAEPSADPRLVISQIMTLEVGDIIATGTPGGGAAAHNPPLWLRGGMTVSVTVEGIGTLTNPVLARSI